jgi:hypothetical protein
MPKPAKRSKRKSRSENVTFAFSPEDLDLIDRAAARSLEPRATWGYRRMVFAARKELGLDPEPKK